MFDLCDLRPHTSREGEPSGPGQPPGPLALVLKASRHERFERSGCDLVARVKLPLFNALAGGAVPVKTLDGRWVAAVCRIDKLLHAIGSLPSESKTVADSGSWGCLWG